MVTVLLLVLLAYTVSTAPVKYDQRQEGDFNVHAHLENFVIVLLPSNGVNLLDFTAKAVSNRKDHPLLQSSQAEDSNKVIVNKFVSPSSSDGTKLPTPDFSASKSPYKVDIDKKDCDTSQESNKEVLIAHSPSSTPQTSEAQPDTSVTTQSPVVETTQAPKEAPTEDKQNSPSSPDDGNEKLKDKLASTLEVPHPPSLSDKKDTVTSESVASEIVEEKDKVTTGSKHRDNSKHGTTLSDTSKKEEAEKIVSQAKPKAINFEALQEMSTSEVQKSYEEQVPVLEFSQFLKAINGATVVEDKNDSRERLLSSGLEECGPGWRRDKLGRCEQITPKQRSLLSALQYGISPAN